MEKIVMRPEMNGQRSRKEITDWLVNWIAKELGMPAQEIDPRHSLLEYSMSSLTATILVGDLEDWLGLRLPPSLVWDYPSIDAMADYLLEKKAGAKPPETGIGNLAPEPTEDARQLLDKLDELSDQDVDALLKRLSSSDQASA